MEDFALFTGLLADGLVEGRVELLADGVDLLRAHCFEELAKLAVDGNDSLDPVEASEVRIDRTDGAIEVIEHGQDVDDHGGVGEAGALRAILLNAAFVVDKIGRAALPILVVGLGLFAFSGEFNGNVAISWRGWGGCGGLLPWLFASGFGSHVGTATIDHFGPLLLFLFRGQSTTSL